jgi:hypothetical protein
VGDGWEEGLESGAALAALEERVAGIEPEAGEGDGAGVAGPAVFLEDAEGGAVVSGGEGEGGEGEKERGPVQHAGEILSQGIGGT